MTFPHIYSVALSLIPCLIPPYALRLSRVFGTKRVGWVLFFIFSLLAALQVMRAWEPAGFSLDPGLTLDLLNFLVPVLLLVSMIHIESLFRERLRVEAQEKQLRTDLEAQVQERTAALDAANDELQREILMRRQGEAELRSSKDQYRFLFDKNPQPMWIYDQSNFQMLAFNTAAARHYGYSAAEFQAKLAVELCVQEDVEAFITESAQSASGSMQTGAWRHRKKDGSVIEVETTCLDLVYNSRSARLVLANEVTAKRALQAQLLQSQKMQVTNQVAGGVADRFSQLLAAIEADAIALSHGEQVSECEEKAKRIAARASAAAGLTRQLFALVGRHPMEPKMVDLTRLLESQLPMLQARAGNQIRVETHFAENLPSIAADPALVTQVVNKLATNAVEAMPGGGTLSISTLLCRVDEERARLAEGAKPGTFVCLGIQDTGCGMTPEVQAKLFEPFFSTKQRDRATGLGLASVHGLVSQHSGWIEVTSQPGVGTLFNLFLPCGHLASAPKRNGAFARNSLATI
jgi:two-component system cell cycle sensor histidine kinase/response regulator CckA